MVVRLIFVVCVSLIFAQSVVFRTVVSLPVTHETAPMPHSGDAADDPTIWVHPTDRKLSTIIGTDKLGGIAVYDLAGKQLQYLSRGKINNVDVRYGFSISGISTDIVAATKSDTSTIVLYQVNPETRQLEDIAARIIPTYVEPLRGLCMYHSQATGRYYVFVTTYERGHVQQWELVDNGNKRIDAVLVRSLMLGSNVEGCAADDAYGDLYLGEEEQGIWKYGAEPHEGETRVLIDTTDSNGHLVSEVEGLSLYIMKGSAGYLMASSQGSNQFVIYSRDTNTYLGTFEIAGNQAIDGVTNTDGIAVTSASLGDEFPNGLFVAQDHVNTQPEANQNFKLLSWTTIAEAFDLDINSVWHPRQFSELKE